jgi:hypothetical protein
MISTRQLRQKRPTLDLNRRDDARFRLFLRLDSVGIEDLSLRKVSYSAWARYHSTKGEDLVLQLWWPRQPGRRVPFPG